MAVLLIASYFKLETDIGSFNDSLFPQPLFVSGVVGSLRNMTDKSSHYFHQKGVQKGMWLYLVMSTVLLLNSWGLGTFSFLCYV